MTTEAMQELFVRNEAGEYIPVTVESIEAIESDENSGGGNIFTRVGSAGWGAVIAAKRFTVPQATSALNATGRQVRRGARWIRRHAMAMLITLITFAIVGMVVFGVLVAFSALYAISPILYWVALAGVVGYSLYLIYQDVEMLTAHYRQLQAEKDAQQTHEARVRGAKPKSQGAKPKSQPRKGNGQLAPATA